MATWGEFAQAAPELAERGAQRLGVGIAYLATTGRDGQPLVHPVVPLIAGGRLFVFVALGTPKERNLRRDGRYALHAVLGKDDEEFLITGRAVVANDWASRFLAAAEAVRIGMTTKDDLLMEFMVERAHWAVWENVAKPNMNKISKQWHERESVSASREV